MSAYKKYTQNMSLRTKLFLNITLIAIIPFIVIAFFLYTKIYSMVLSDTIRQNQTMSAATAPLIGEQIDRITDLHHQIEDLPSLTMLMTGNLVSASPLYSEDLLLQLQEETSALMKGSDIQAVRIYVDLPEEVLTHFTESSQGMIQPLTNMRGAYWKGIFAGSRIEELFCPSFYLTHAEIRDLGDAAYITCHTYSVGRDQYTVYIASYYQSSLFQELLSSSLPFKEAVSYIVNERNSIVATTDSALSGMYYIGYSDISEYFMSSNNFLKKNVLGEDVYAAMNNIPQTGWYVVTILPAASIRQQSMRIILWNCLLIIALLLLTFFLTLKISSSITGRLSLVSDQMARIKYEPPMPLATPEEHDEIGTLIDTYNYMCRMIQELLQEQGKAAEELRVSEFNSLQAQINPHFLYNTMDMINWMAAEGQTDAIAQAVQDLSRFYKLTLSRQGADSTIEEETEHVGIYVRIQNMRFHDKIDFLVDLPDELLSVPIPKLTLQPVVENAILHGIFEKESKSGTIVLTGWLEGDDAVLLVSDDGVGIDPEFLPRILSGEPGASSGSNIAIYNIHRRLQIRYGEGYGLTYRSTCGVGTEVEIRIRQSASGDT